MWSFNLHYENATLTELWYAKNKFLSRATDIVVIGPSQIGKPTYTYITKHNRILRSIIRAVCVTATAKNLEILRAHSSYCFSRKSFEVFTKKVLASPRLYTSVADAHSASQNSLLC